MRNVIDKAGTIGGRTGRMRHPLLSSCALATALVLGQAPARAQSLNGSTFTGFNAVGTGTGATVLTDNGSGTSSISITQAQVIIDWVPNNTATSANGGTGKINFMPGGNSVTFESGYGGGGFTVLNRIGGTEALTRPIGLDGTINSTGNIWFYSPGGIIAGATSVFNVGSLVLTANAIDTSGGGLFTTGGTSAQTGTIRFSSALGSTSTVEVVSGAQINLSAANSYLAVVAPRIVQASGVTVVDDGEGGLDVVNNVNVNGSAAYVAAEAVDITINGGLFNINVSRGTTGGSAPGGATVINHSGNTLVSGANGKVFFVAVPKNDAITMLVSGDLGYATSAEAVNGAVVLSAGYNISAGSIGSSPVAPAGTTSNLRLTGGTVNASLTARAVNSATVDSSSSQLTVNGPVDIRGADALLAAAGHDATIVGNATVRTERPTLGTAKVRVDAASVLDISGNLLIDAIENGYGSSTQAATASFTASGTGAVATIGGDLIVDASVDNNQTGGTATGGTASLSSLLGASVTVTGTTTVNANASGGSGGSGTGGTASIIGDGGSLDLGTTTVTATGGSESNFSSSTPGVNRGGTAKFTTSGNDTIGALTLDASAESGYGGGGAVGGRVEIVKSGSDTASIESIEASAAAQGGSSSSGGAGGDATGGTIILTLAGGTLFGETGYGIDLDVGASGGSGQDGGDATGGSVTINAFAGLLAGDALIIDASAAGGNASNEVGNARGGSVTIAASRGTVGFATTTVDTSAAGNTAQGGTIDIRTLSVGNGGTLGALSLGGTSLDAYADAASPEGSTAGRIAITDDGEGTESMTFESLSANADGTLGSDSQIFQLVANNGAITVGGITSYAIGGSAIGSPGDFTVFAHGISIAASGSGGLDVDGTVNLVSSRSIFVTHNSPARTTIAADRIDFTAADIIFVGSGRTAGAVLDSLSDGSSIQDRQRLVDRNNGPVRPAGYLEAENLRFAPGTGLYIQNTGLNNRNPDDRAGFTAGYGGGVEIVANGRRPEVIINGRQARGDGGYYTGTSLIPRLTLTAGEGVNATAADFADGSTVNGCLLNGGGCIFYDDEVEVEVEVEPPLFPPVQDVINFNLTANLPSLSEPLIELADFTSFALEPLIDDPVTGAGNDDLWLNGGDEDEDEKPSPPTAANATGNAPPRG